MFHSLGETRSSLKQDHLLHTPDTFIRTPLPGAEKVDFIVHVGPRLGAGFTQMTAEFLEGGVLAPSAPGVQRFLYVLDGEIEVSVTGEGVQQLLRADHFAYFPEDTPHQIRATRNSRAALIEKSYEAVYAPTTGSMARTSDNPSKREVVIGNEANIASEALGGDPGLQVRRLMTDGPGWDFAVNTMTYEPGAALAMVEIHVMEHGLLMLEGGGIYRLGDSWYPVAKGDFIWMAPYCPQWFGALGKIPAKYLIYKDWYRHPLGEPKP